MQLVDIDPEQLWFLRGILAGLASSGQIIRSDEIQRLCHLSEDEARAYLRAAGQGQHEDEPDFSVIAVDERGQPDEGPGGGWSTKLCEAQRYWRDRRCLDEDSFRKDWGDTPTFPRHPSRTD